MVTGRNASLLLLLFAARAAMAQVLGVRPQVLVKEANDGSVTVIEVAAHFVTAIRLPETVNSVVVGDPTLFQVEHSDREPELVFVKALTEKPAESNLLISTTRGHEASLLLVSRGTSTSATPASVDFLLRYSRAGGFLIEPDYPSESVAQTVAVGSNPSPVASAGFDPFLPTAMGAKMARPSSAAADPPVTHTGLDALLAQQERAPLPKLFGQHVEGEAASKECVLAGTSKVVDRRERVMVLFSAVNPTDHNILLASPQVQLGGKIKSGKIIRRSHWTVAEQIPVTEFLLSKRRLAPGERADGVLLFERPPYKQSSQTLFLQIADAGAVDRPTLAPIGFGINTSQEEPGHGRPQKER